MLPKTNRRSNKMPYVKFNGILKEIIEQYPNIDVTSFLQDSLQVPLEKAEELAARIEKEYYLKSTGKTEPNLQRVSVDKTKKPEVSQKINSYPWESLSEKEFELFIKWLLQELGYEVYPDKHATDSSVGFIVSRDGEKIEAQAIKCPKNILVQNSSVLKVQEQKSIHGCQRAIILTTAYFSPIAISDAQKLNVELWDRDILNAKITKARKNAELEVQSCFPPYKGSLLESLLRLEETGEFMLESRTDEKYDLHLPGVKFPLLTFEIRADEVRKCVFRIKFNEPVGEFDGEALIWCDRTNDRFGPDGAEAYSLITGYLEQFLE
jgi:HJR/Mrr/RecB family endonuclease